MKRSKTKRGISPVIATVLLIAIVIVTGLIVFLWFRGIAEETITKFSQKNIKLVCRDVQFQASYSNNILSISNTGTVPLYSMKLKISGGGSFKTEDMKELNKSGLIYWPTIGLNQGGAYSEDISGISGIETADEITLIPVLVGSIKGGGEKIHTCDEKQGFKINI